MALTLRRPAPGELPQLAALYRETRLASDIEYAPSYINMRTDEDAYFQKIWRAVFENPDTNRAMVLWDETRPIGFVRVGAMTDYLGLYQCPITVPPRTGEIHQLYVLPGIVGRGYGLTLLKAALSDLKDMGFSGLIGCAYRKNERIRDFIADLGGHHLVDADLHINDPAGLLAPHVQVCSFYYAELPDSLPGTLMRFALEKSVPTT